MPSNAQQRLPFTRYNAFPEGASPFPRFRLPRAEKTAPADAALGKLLEVVQCRDAAEMSGSRNQTTRAVHALPSLECAPYLGINTHTSRPV